MDSWGQALKNKLNGVKVADNSDTQDQDTGVNRVDQSKATAMSSYYNDGQTQEPSMNDKIRAAMGLGGKK